MKRYIRLLFLSLIFVCFISCDDEAVYTPDERFVLQAYLYANEPVWDITVKNAVPLTVVDSVGAPINDATITLYKNDMAYKLVSSSDSGTYRYPEGNLSVNFGDHFRIEASVNGQVAKAETIVPEPPQGVVISKDTIRLPKIKITSGKGGFGGISELLESMRAINLEVFWDNPNGELHFVVIENAEENQESIMPDLGGNFGKGGARGTFRLVKRPTRENSQPINMTEIQYWGKYVVKVYRVNQEYADLYENLEQDSRDLNEPPTNVKGGLGIFSAFNSQNVYFEVVKQ